LPLHAGAEHNNVRIHLLELLIAQSHPFDYSPGKVFHDNISPGNESLGQLHSLGMSQVKGNAKLAGVVLVKITTAV
jgi:hypothetical protein